MLCVKSKLKRIALPEMKLLVETAGEVLGVVGLLYKVARALAPLSEYRSAVPWNFITSLSKEGAYGVVVSILSQASGRVVPREETPNTLASCRSGRNPPSVPPLLT